MSVCHKTEQEEVRPTWTALPDVATGMGATGQTPGAKRSKEHVLPRALRGAPGPLGSGAGGESGSAVSRHPPNWSCFVTAAPGSEHAASFFCGREGGAAGVVEASVPCFRKGVSELNHGGALNQ